MQRKEVVDLTISHRYLGKAFVSGGNAKARMALQLRLISSPMNLHHQHRPPFITT
jgi:hypothetical protein